MALETGINSFAVRDPETLMKRVSEADVLVISGLWQNQLLDRAKRLRFIQSIGAGTDQFPRDALARRGIRWPVPAASMLARWPSTRWR